jgi:hypothetical protein
VDSWEVRAFEQTDEEAIGHHLGVAGGSVLEQCEETPSYVEPRDEVVHADFGEEKSEGQLSEHCTESIDCLKVHEFVAVEIEIVREARDVGIVWLMVSLGL